MVDVTLIKETITELLEANVDKETIFSTLKDIGVEEGEIEKYYSELTSNNTSSTPIPAQEETAAPQTQPAASEEKKSDLPYHSIDDHVNENTKKPDAILHNTEDLKKEVENDPQQEPLKQTTSEVDSLNNSIETPTATTPITNSISSSADNTALTTQLGALQEQITDLKAQVNGLTKIMKDILDENRNILNKIN